MIANATKLMGLLQYRTYDLDAYKVWTHTTGSVLGAGGGGTRAHQVSGSRHPLP